MILEPERLRFGRRMICPSAVSMRVWLREMSRTVPTVPSDSITSPMEKG